MDRRSDILHGSGTLGVSKLPSFWRNLPKSAATRKAAHSPAVQASFDDAAFNKLVEHRSAPTAAAAGGGGGSGVFETLGARIVRLAEVAAALHLGQTIGNDVREGQGGIHS